MLENEDQISRIKSRWVVGGAGAQHCPDEWQDLVGADDDSELKLVALVGQLVDSVYRPAPVGTLTAFRDLPTLALPTIPDAHRAAFRRLFASLRSYGQARAALLTLVACRGYAVHPSDWMPTAGSNVIPLYQPWTTWLSDAASAAPSEDLTSETWADWSAASRRDHLRALRQRDPAQALALIAANAPAEPAAVRLELVDVLSTNLDERDTPFLKSLANDRSEKVRLRATQLLSILRAHTGDADAAAGLTSFFKVTRKGLMRKRVVKPTKLTDNAAVAKRLHLLQRTTLAELAEALGMDSLELVATWTPNNNDHVAKRCFTDLVADTGSDADACAYYERALRANNGKFGVHIGEQSLMRHEALRNRVSAEARHHLALTIAPTVANPALAVAFCDDQLGYLSHSALRKSPMLETVRALFTAARDTTAKNNGVAQQQLSHQLTELGFIVDADAAAAFIEEFIALGVMTADPALQVLQFNAALPPNGVRS